MNSQDWLAEQFEANRTHLQAVAYRMLGSLSEADDAVQESWLRLSRSGASDVANLGGWLTTVVAHLCLDHLRARAARREVSLEARVADPSANHEAGSDPEQEALLAESVGLALLVVLDRLAPAERIAFVLHDLFDEPFEEIASIVDRSPTAARQLASRARRRVRGASARPDADLAQHRSVVEAFLAASHAGDFEALLAVLDPEVVFRTDFGAQPGAAPREIRGARAVAGQYSGRAHGARPVLVNGSVGMLVAPHGRLFLVMTPTITHGKIVEINVVSDPEALRQMRLAVLDN